MSQEETARRSQEIPRQLRRAVRHAAAAAGRPLRVLRRRRSRSAAAVGTDARPRVLQRRVRPEDHAAHPVRHAAGRAQPDRGAGPCRGGAPRRRELGGTAQDRRARVGHRRALSGEPGQRAAQRAARQGSRQQDRRYCHEDIVGAAFGAVLSMLALSAARPGLSRAEGRHLHRQELQVPHRRGDAGAPPALPDHRRADRTAGADPAWYIGVGRGLPQRGVRRRAVRTRPAARCDQVFHHPAGQRRRRKIFEAVGRHAGEVSTLQLRRLDRRAPSAGDRRPRHQASAPGDGQLDGRHAHLAVGREVFRPSWMRWCRWQRSRPRFPAATG